MSSAEQKPHYHVCAGLIRKDGSFLISRRAKGTHLEGVWEFPGGKQEAGEDLAECLERELREELGIETETGPHLITVDHEYADKCISLHMFRSSWVRGEPRPIQCQEVRWVQWTELLSLPFPPPDRKVIQWLTAKGTPLWGDDPSPQDLNLFPKEAISHVLPTKR